MIYFSKRSPTISIGLIAALLCMSLPACSQTYVVTESDKNRVVYEIEKETLNKSANILSAEQSVSAKNLRVKNDTLHFTTSENITDSIPVEKITSIQFKDRLKGAVRGGALVGVFGGVIYGIAELASVDSDNTVESAAAPLTFMLGAIAGVGIGVIPGGIGGAIIGYQTIYNFKYLNQATDNEENSDSSATSTTTVTN